VIHHLEVKALQVGKIAGKMEGEDLPLAALRDLVAADEALDDETALGWPVTLPNDIVISWQALAGELQGCEALPLVGREGG
jgi:hypothetical protein